MACPLSIAVHSVGTAKRSIEQPVLLNAGALAALWPLAEASPVTRLLDGVQHSRADAAMQIAAVYHQLLDIAAQLCSLPSQDASRYNALF